MRQVRVAVLARDTEQVQRAARPQMLPAGELLIDHDSAGSSGVEQAPLHDPDPVDRNAQRAVRAGDSLQQRVRNPAAPRQPHVVQDRRPHRRHVAAPRQRTVISGEPGPMRYHQHARGVAPLQQPRVSRIGPPRTSRRRQHHPANQPKQQRQPGQRPPPRPQPRPQGKPNRAHEQIQLPTAAAVKDADLPCRGGAGAPRLRRGAVPGYATGPHPAHPRS